MVLPFFRPQRGELEDQAPKREREAKAFHSFSNENELVFSNWTNLHSN